MADLTNSSWSEADSSNTQPAPNGVPPGILPSELGGSLRAVMGATKRWHSRSNAMLSSTGSANAYVLTYAVAPAGYVKGEVFLFFAHLTNTGAATLNINALGARTLLRADGGQLLAGEIVAGQVVTVVFDGVNFLAQSIVTKDFRSNVSIVKENDAFLTIEDTSAPTTTFRRKAIFSSRNVGGGNDWLFRQTRPSDGAIEDFILRSGTGGTIWTTGNFNPSLKADLAGSTFLGTVSVRNTAAQGSISLVSGSTDRTGYLAFNDKDGARHGYIGWSDGGSILLQAEKGDFNFAGGTPRIGGNQIWHAGNFNPDLRALLNNPATFTGIGFTSRDSYIYADTGTNNLVLRTGPASAPKYTVIDADGTFRPSGTIRAPGEIIAAGNITVGSGQTYSQINMFDSDEGQRYIHNNSNRIGFLGKAGDWIFQAGDDGTVWTKQLGDLNTRIENRAYAHGDERGAAWARQEAGARVAKTGDTMTGRLTVQSAYPAFRMLYPGVRDVEWQVRENGGTYLWDHSAGTWNVYIGPGGDMQTRQLGDINTRIEDRAYAWATTRRDEAKTFATAEANRGRDEANNNSNANFFNKTTGAAQQVSNLAAFNAGAIDIVRGGHRRERLEVGTDGYFRFKNGDNDAQSHAFGPGGDIWTAQFGDLHNRIEDRSAAWARQESVARAHERVAKTGDTMTGDLTVSKAYPTLNMLYGGVRHLGWQVRENAQTYLWDHSLGNWQMRVDTDGGIVARGQLYAGNGSAAVAADGNVHGSVWGGWLSNRIGGIDNAVNNRLVKTGDTMSGNLTISKANPGISLFYGGVWHGLLWVGNDGVFRYSNGDGGGDKFRVGTGGDLWCAQLGDLNTRIEDRAYAWANTRQANLGFTPVEQGGGHYMGSNKIRIGWDGPASACRLQVDDLQLERILTRNWINPVIDIRLAYAGDLDNNWNKDQSYAEPYNGGVLTSRYVTSNQFIVDSWKGGRWRYLQKQDSYGNWYTVGYV